MSSPGRRMMEVLAETLYVFMLSFAGCAGNLEQQHNELEKSVHALNAEIQKLRREVSDGLTLALCPPELAELLSDVRRECTSRVEEKCTTRQIRGAVIAADPDHRGRFLKLMSTLRHEVLYMNKDAPTFALFRENRLVQLTQTATLQNTQYIIVTSPEDGGEVEASKRAQFVARELVKRSIPRDKIQVWIYSFPAVRADIARKVDLPSIGETQQLSRGVWVFRADC